MFAYKETVHLFKEMEIKISWRYCFIPGWLAKLEKPDYLLDNVQEDVRPHEFSCTTGGKCNLT